MSLSFPSPCAWLVALSISLPGLAAAGSPSIDPTEPFAAPAALRAGEAGEESGGEAEGGSPGASPVPSFVSGPGLARRAHAQIGGGAALLGTGIGAAVAAFPVWFYSLVQLVSGDSSSIDTYYAGDLLWLYGGGGINFGAASIKVGNEMRVNLLRRDGADLVVASVANDGSYWDLRGAELAGGAAARHGAFTLGRGAFDVFFLLPLALVTDLFGGDSGVYFIPGIAMMVGGAVEIVVGAVGKGANGRKARQVRNAAVRAVSLIPSAHVDPRTGAVSMSWGLRF